MKVIPFIGVLAALCFGMVPLASAAHSSTYAAQEAPPTWTPVPTELPVDPPWEVNCTDDIEENGYMVQKDCIPGLVTVDAQLFENPGMFGGAMSSYAPGIMQKVCENRGLPCKNYKGAVAVMGCGDIGKKAYINAGGGWEGPFLIADCSGRRHIYMNIMLRHIAVEVDYETAQRMGSPTIGWVMVKIPQNGPWIGPVPNLWDWYKENKLAFTWAPDKGMDLVRPATPTPLPSSTPTPTPLPLGDPADHAVRLVRYVKPLLPEASTSWFVGIALGSLLVVMGVTFRAIRKTGAVDPAHSAAASHVKLHLKGGKVVPLNDIIPLADSVDWDDTSNSPD